MIFVRPYTNRLSIKYSYSSREEGKNIIALAADKTDQISMEQIFFDTVLLGLAWSRTINTYCEQY